MPIIKHESTVGAVYDDDDYEDEDEDESRAYCLRCYEMTNQLNYLGPLILQKDESEPEDYDDWRQCRCCGNKYLRTEISIEHEGELADFVEIDDAGNDSIVETLFPRVNV